MVLIWYITGAVMCKSLIKFVRWSALRSRWIDILGQMDKIEERYLKGTVYEEDLKDVYKRQVETATISVREWSFI